MFEKFLAKPELPVARSGTHFQNNRLYFQELVIVIRSRGAEYVFSCFNGMFDLWITYNVRVS